MFEICYYTCAANIPSKIKRSFCYFSKDVILKLYISLIRSHLGLEY
jgi:hypothetical protein